MSTLCEGPTDVPQSTYNNHPTRQENKYDQVNHATCSIVSKKKKGKKRKEKKREKGCRYDSTLRDGCTQKVIIKLENQKHSYSQSKRKEGNARIDRRKMHRILI
jgi:hypothetical protein